MFRQDPPVPLPSPAAHRRRLGPFTRKLLRRLSPVDSAPALAPHRALAVRPRSELRREYFAVVTVLVQAARDLDAPAPADSGCGAYDAYFREDCPLGGPAPSSVGAQLVRALPGGEVALAAVVAREAGILLGRRTPGRRLLREVHRHIELFELLAYEAARLRESY